MKDFELAMRLRNNQLKSRRKDLGLSMTELAEVSGVSYSHYTALENMRGAACYTPMTKKGEWRKIAIRLAEFYGVTPEVLWPKAILRVKQSEIVKELDARELLALAGDVEEKPSAEDLLLHAEKIERLKSAFSTLPQRQQAIISARSSSDATLDSIGKEHGIGRERVRQIEIEGYQKIRKIMWQDFGTSLRPNRVVYDIETSRYFHKKCGGEVVGINCLGCGAKAL